MAKAQDVAESTGTGALIGTAFMPGVGTAVGAGAGFLYGMGGGNLLNTFSGGGVNPNARFKEQNQFRHAQIGALNTVGNWGMTGQGPSAAQTLLNQQRQKDNTQAFSNAKAMAGGNPALQQRLASDQQATNNAQAAYGASVLRSEEQQQAMDNYLKGLQGGREADIDVGRAKTAVDVSNAEKRGGFLSGLVGGGMGGIGKLF